MIQHQQRVIIGNDEEDMQRIYVRRNFVLENSLKAFSRSTFNVYKILRVNFVGEGGVDDEGPRREFFCILMKVEFAESGLFSGWPENVVPVHSIQAVAENRFYLVGTIISTSSVQGGQPPLCFSKAVADYIVFDEVKGPPCLDDIPDLSVRQSMKKVINYSVSLLFSLYLQ